MLMAERGWMAFVGLTHRTQDLQGYFVSRVLMPFFLLNLKGLHSISYKKKRSFAEECDSKAKKRLFRCLQSPGRAPRVRGQCRRHWAGAAAPPAGWRGHCVAPPSPAPGYLDTGGFPPCASRIMEWLWWYSFCICSGCYLNAVLKSSLLLRHILFAFAADEEHIKALCRYHLLTLKL